MTDIINHSFNIEFASRYGIEESIIFGNIYHWCIHNKNNDNNLKKGKDGIERYYTFNSISALQQEYRYISITKVYRVIEKLENEGLIITGCFNKRVGDRTRWYAITEKGEQIFIECNQTLTSTLYNNLQFSNCKLQNEMHNSQNDRHNLQNEMTLPIINKTINTNVNSSEVDTSDKPKSEPPRFINSNNEVKKTTCSKKPSKTEAVEQYLTSLNIELFNDSRECSQKLVRYITKLQNSSFAKKHLKTWQMEIAQFAIREHKTFKEISKVIDFTFSSWWADKIFSAKNLIDHYGQLYQQMNGSYSKSDYQKKRQSDLDRGNLNTGNWDSYHL